MATSTLPRGLILDLVTPLTERGDVDGSGLDRLLDHVLPHIQGLWLAGPRGGEGEKLEGEVREELFCKSLSRVRGKVPLFVWVTQATAQSTLHTLHLLQSRLETSRYPGPVFWVDTPLYYQGNRGLPLYYRSMVSRFNRGWVLHNDPSLVHLAGRPFKRENIRTRILKELCTMDGMEGLIFSGSLDRAHNYRKAAGSRPSFRVYDGEESRFLSHPSRSGVISVGANLVPKAWQKITRSTLNLGGDREAYPDSLHQIWETGESLRNLIEAYGSSPAPLIKQALTEMGILRTPAWDGKGEDLEQRGEKLRLLLKGRQG